MGERFISVDDTGGLEAVFARSKEGPVLLFKHSLTCPISAAAYTQMGRLDHDVALVVVQKARDISREVESRTGVRHESPQALIILDGKVIWSDSHWGITTDGVEKAMREAEKSREPGV
jgi:bacillithiol system protein YtxJ